MVENSFDKLDDEELIKLKSWFKERSETKYKLKHFECRKVPKNEHTYKYKIFNR